MQRKTILVVCCAIIAIGGALLGWRSRRAIARAQATGAFAAQEHSRLAAEIARLEGQIAGTTRQQSQGQTLLSRADSFVAAARQATTAGTQVERVLQVPPDNAEMQARALHTLRFGFGLKYGAFYRALGLDAERIAKFETLLADYEGRKIDLRATERSIPFDRATAVPFPAVTIDGRRTEILLDPSIAKLRREADAQLQQGQAALLGAEGYARLQEFEASVESRSFVGDLVGNLALTAHPLTAEQGKGLVQALQAGNFTVRIEPEKTDWDAILARARPLLAPGQFEELQALAATHKLKVTRNEVARLLQGEKK